MIKESIEKELFHYIPSSYSGCSHHELLNDEIERDIQWIFSNPWKSGYMDIWGKNPNFIAPYNFEDLRRKSLDIYFESNANSIKSIDHNHENKGYVKFYYHKKLYSIPSLLVHNLKMKDLFDYQSKYKKHGLSLVWYNKEGLSSLNKLYETLNSYPFKNMVLENCKGIVGTLIKKNLSYSPALIYKTLWRQKRRPLSLHDDAFKRYLLDIKNDTHPVIIKDSIHSHNVHINGSASGSMHLNNDDFKIYFQEGQPFAFKVPKKNKTLPVQIEGYIKTEDGKKVFFENMSSFTFDNSKSWGLRNIIKLYNQKQGTIDYFFHENSNFLLCQYFAQYNWDQGSSVLKEFYPFTWTFPVHIKDKITIQCLYPDLDSYEKTLNANETYRSLFRGNRFLISFGGFRLVFAFFQDKRPLIHSLLLEIDPTKKASFLNINFFNYGGTMDLVDVIPYEQRFSFVFHPFYQQNLLNLDLDLLQKDLYLYDYIHP